MYDELFTKVNNIDTSDFVLKTKYATDKWELEKKIPDTSGLVKKTDYNTKITELENKVLDISNLATKTALTTVENKIHDISNLATKSALATVENKVPNTSNLVKKTDYDTKITEMENKLTNHNHDKYIYTSKFNTLANNVFNTRIAQANSVTKTVFDSNLSRLNRKITQNKSKHLVVNNDFNYYHGKNYFDEDGELNYYVFQPLVKYLGVAHVGNIIYILSWKSRGLHVTKIKAIVTTNYQLIPRMNIYDMGKIRIRFDESFFK